MSLSSGSKRWLTFTAAISILLITALLSSARQGRTRTECINNLRQIDGAERCWALEQNRDVGSPLTAADATKINEYLKDGSRACPSGGTYTYHPVGSLPTCSIPSHTL